MGYTSGESKQMKVNYVGNYGILGPDSSSKRLFKPNEKNKVKMYESGNLLDSDKDGKLDGKDQGGAMFDGDWDDSGSPFAFEPVTTHDAKTALTLVLAWAGARPWSRDEPDVRVIADVETGKGGLINSQSKVGGWGDLAKGAKVNDGDGDGLPDAWELAVGTNPTKKDHNGDLDGDGYTNLEEYLHWAARPGQ